jgi:hypothetical protein
MNHVIGDSSFRVLLRIMTVYVAGIITTGFGLAQNIITQELGTDYLFPRAPQIASDTHLPAPGQMAVAADGSVLIALPAVNCVVRLRINENELSVFAGNGIRGLSGDGSAATDAALNQPAGVAVGPSGSVYISDTGNRRIRVVSPSGTITTLAGPGIGHLNGRTTAGIGFLAPLGLAVDRDENVYVADSAQIYRIGRSGVSDILAGTGSSGSFGPIAPGTEAIHFNLLSPQGLLLAPNGDILIADLDAIYRVNADGILTLIAGHNNRGFSGDGGPARNAQLSGVTSLALDPVGDIFLSDTSNNRIRRTSICRLLRRDASHRRRSPGGVGRNDRSVSDRAGHRQHRHRAPGSALAHPRSENPLRLP